MTKADDERELAGYVAPIVRGTSEVLLRRRVKTYDRETGEVTGEVTMRQVIGGLAEVTKLEIEVIDGKRPKHFTCGTCGKVFEVPKTHIPKTCDTCRANRQQPCPCGCGQLPPPAAFAPSNLARRAGRPWRCRHSAARMRVENMTPEQRSETTRKWNASRTPEQRSEAVRRGHAARAPELRESMRVDAREWGRKGACQRAAKTTPEQRSEAVRRAWETRRAKAAAVLPSPDGGAQKTGADD